MIAENLEHHSVSLMCRLLGVSRSGFYASRSRPVSARACENEALVSEMRQIERDFRRSYGSPRMPTELAARGLSCSENRAARLMRENGIVAKPRRKFVVTTQSDPSLPIAPNVLDRRFSPSGPNQVWASDITYIRTLTGWLYLAVTLDLFSRKVVGWAASSRIDSSLVVRALAHAIEQRNPGPDLIHHSDQGSQYASTGFRDALDKRGMICSMSRRGNCWDNSVVESFFGSLKTEWLDDLYKNHAEARKDVFEYIEVFYNRRRSHSTLGGVSPEEFERRSAAA